MATKFDVTALTLNPLEAQDVSEAVMEKVFVQTEMSSIHNIETGVQMKSQIVFVDQLEVGGEALTGCTPAEQDGLTFTQKYWDPALIAGRFTNCAADLNNLFKLFRKAQKANPDYFDKTGSQEMGMLMTKIVDSLKVSINAKVWYGDTAAAVQPGGNFTIAGFNAGLWNQFDGLWKQIFADADIPVYTIDANNGATYDLQVLPDGKSYEIFKGMYELADPRLLGDSERQFLVTRSIWDNYLAYLESTQKNGGITSVLDDGRTVMQFRGINVVLMNEWDRLQNKYQNDGTVVYQPNRALLTTPDNIPVATLSESDLSSLESFYDQKDKTNIVDYSYFLDAKFGESYMAVAAYYNL